MHRPVYMVLGVCAMLHKGFHGHSINTTSIRRRQIRRMQAPVTSPEKRRRSARSLPIRARQSLAKLALEGLVLSLTLPLPLVGQVDPEVPHHRAKALLVLSVLLHLTLLFSSWEPTLRQLWL